ncbi:MexE family multidrug efflux RND transporter periplasmic adaptor subunit [Terrihabitans soli]|uniref:MexE family multidrug efflux RND transporter periplasmic adaptor subunit n=1 Tax=Terrihabitans soli TaxID=708113 RepID=A0A6S6QM04_9HYPH|nr:efflux RND transporter periplasmic adaptor subunit [Terrihabitans soli]BCJ92373.1 MexE family multidrug efflux RND transporter periplasmic adaptor subunit [Terrihabitans soli]
MLSSLRLSTAAILLFSFALPATAQEMPALPVSVAKAVKRQVVDWAEMPGRFEAANYVEVRAQVAGELESVHFEDGQIVKPGDLLFRIDSSQFKAAAEAAEAAIRTNQTRLDLAAQEQKRGQELRGTGNIPESVFQQRNQAFLEAQANLDQSKAEFERARISLGYTDITAPISGKVGRKLVTEGNLVSDGSAGTLLTTIVQFDPVYFYFDVDEQSFLTYQRSRTGEALSQHYQQVFIALSDETTFTHQAKLDFIANQVDPATGTIRVRAVMPNADQFVTPGLFGRVKLQTRPPYEALVIPDDAITLDQTRRIVMTVNKDGVVEPKEIQTGPRIGKFRVVTSGITENDTLIVNGLMRARPGGKVVPTPVEIKVPDDLTRPDKIEN